ncbi:hypothetical protein G3A_13835 [Bacillus sp. 17376]|nr:hypothetical protein G3A_13835 [Bacillus sp. 17376]
MSLIGAPKLQKPEKEVTNKADWRPETPETGKRGRQQPPLLLSPFITPTNSGI